MPDSIENKIREVFDDVLPKDGPESLDKIPLADLDIDSLDFFEAIMILEEEHGIIIPDTALHSSITLEEIYAIAQRPHSDG